MIGACMAVGVASAGMRWALLLVAVAGCSEIRTPTLEASADSTTLAPGQTTQLHVIRHFEGGPFDDVTSQVQYSVTPKSIITISGTGQVTPASDSGVATVTITEKDDTAFTTIRFSVQTVAAKIVSIKLDPSPEIVLTPGQTKQITATAVMSDLTSVDVTKNLAWTSSNINAATVGNEVTSFGLVNAITQGDATITALDKATNTNASIVVLVRGGTDAGADGGP